MTLTIEYKCRRCGGTYTKPGATELPPLDYLRSLALTDVHPCPDQEFGVLDLVGMREVTK